MSIRLEFTTTCLKCGREVSKWKIFPRKNYEKFAKNTIIKCGYCETIIKSPPYSVIECKFFTKGNSLFIRFGTMVKEIAILDEENIYFDLLGLSEYLGKFTLKYGENKLIETFMDKGEMIIDFDDKVIKQFNNKKLVKNVKQ